jgi:hypothetical protein
LTILNTVRARKTRSFVYALIIVLVFSIEARQLPVAVDRYCSSVTRHTEIPLPRDKEPLRFGSTSAKFVRGNLVSTLPGKATNIASRGSRHAIVTRLNAVLLLATYISLHPANHLAGIRIKEIVKKFDDKKK